MSTDLMAAGMGKGTNAKPQKLLLTNARLFDGTGEEIIPNGAVWLEDGVVRRSGPADAFRDVPQDVRRIDLRGRFLMPGMTESHAHISYFGATSPSEQDRTPVEESMLHAIDHARIMLGSGYTSAISFGGVHNVDVNLRNGINNSWVCGPRLLAAGRDISATSGLVDWHPEHFKPQIEGLGMIVDGPWAIRAAVRKIRKLGADVVKIFLDGENVLAQSQPGELTYTDEETFAAVEEAHRHNLKVVCHARSAAAVKQAVRAGVDIVGHGNYLDDEAIDLLREARHRLQVGPAIAWELALLQRAEEFGFSRKFFEQKGYKDEVEFSVKAVAALRKAGVKVLPGGDFGLLWTPHGAYAQDLQNFTDFFSFSAFDALLAATRDAGSAMGMGGMVGTLEAGKFADLVVVDGDPIADIRILQDHSKLAAVMKGGIFYHDMLDKPPAMRGQAADRMLQNAEKFAEPAHG